MSDENDQITEGRGPDEQADQEANAEEMRQAIADLPPEELRYLQLVATLQKVVGDVQGWLARAEQALHNHNLRLNVIETFLVHADFADLRAKFLAGEMVLADLQRIANDYIQPQMQAKALELQKLRDEAIAKQQAEAQAQSSVIINPNTGRPASEASTLLTPDGRQVIIRED